jgi:hypothetical protein
MEQTMTNTCLVWLRAVEGAEEPEGTILMAISEMDENGILHNCSTPSWPFHHTETGHYEIIAVKPTKELMP